MSPANWHECVLCKEEGKEDPPKAVPRHVETEHDISFDKYKRIVQERGENVPNSDSSNNSSSSSDSKRDDDTVLRGKGHITEEAFSKMALKSFQETMNDAQRQKQHLVEEKRRAEKEKKQLQKRLMEERQRERKQRQQQQSSSDDQFFKELVLQYFQDMRQEKQRAKTEREEQLEQKINRLEQKIDEMHDGGREYEEEGGTTVKKIEITDDSIKSVTEMGNRFIGMMRQNQLLKLAKDSDEFPDTEELIKQEFMDMASGMGIGQLQPPSIPNSGGQKPNKPSTNGQSKDLEDILAEE